jgi:predicted neutral ceramidase superfamily lipid hydrolase
MIRKILKNWNLKDFLYLLIIVIPVWLFLFVGPCIYAGFTIKKTIITSAIALIIALVFAMTVDYVVTKPDK